MIAALVLFYLLLLSGSIYCCARYDCAVGDVLPLTAIGSVFFLFLFGLLGLLRVGFYCLLVLAAAAFLFSALYLFRTKSARRFVSRFFRFDFFLFTACFLVLLVLNFGRRVMAWDDLRHWGDVVKVMTLYDVFSSNPLAHSMFPEYPPGMALFQYYFQKTLLLFRIGSGMTEWAAFFCYQIFCLLLFFPFLKPPSRGRVSWCLWLLLLLLCPFVYFPSAHSKLMIDLFLASLFSCTLAHVFLPPRKGPLYHLSVCFGIGMLALTKTSGLLLGLLAAGVYLLAGRYPPPHTQDSNKLLRRAAAALCFVFVPTLLWQLSVRAGGQPRAFSLQFGAADSAYRIESLRQFILRFFSQNILDAGAVVTQLTAIFLAAVLLSGLYFTCRRSGKLSPGDETLYRALFWTLPGILVVYSLALCFSYLFSFSPEEAVIVASFPRYIKLIFLALSQLLILMWIRLAGQDAHSGSRVLALLLCAETALLPWQEVLYHFSRSNVQYSIEQRSPSDRITDLLRSAGAEHGDVVWVVSGDPTFYMLIRFDLRDCTVEIPSWSPETPAAECDYLILQDYDDDFPPRYGPLFRDPSEIHPGGAYRLDPDSRLFTEIK